MNSLTILSISDLFEIRKLYLGMEVQVVNPSQDSGRCGVQTGGCGVQGHLLIYISIQGQTLHPKRKKKEERKGNTMKTMSV